MDATQQAISDIQKRLDELEHRLHQSDVPAGTIKTRHLQESIKLTTPTLTSPIVTGATITDGTSSVLATSLKSATTSINVSSSTAPSTGQALIATSSTAATWQAVSAISATTAKAQVYRATSVQSINNTTVTKIAFTGETSDPGNNFDSVTNYRFVAPVAGVYFVESSIQFSTLALGDIMTIYIYKNGASERMAVANAAATSNVSIVLSCILTCALSDYLEIYVDHNHGSARDILATSSAASFHLLST